MRSRSVYKTPVTTNILTSSDNQCSSYDNSVVSWGTSAEGSWQSVNTRAFIAGEFIWTGFDYIGEPTPYSWPSKSSYFGAIDTAGFPKDIFYFYQSKWNAAGPTMVHIVPMDWTSWTAGQAVTVWVYSNADSAELFLNGTSQGSKTMNATTTAHLQWSVPFATGTLQAKATKGGTVVATDTVQTAGAAATVSAQGRPRVDHGGWQRLGLRRGGHCRRAGNPRSPSQQHGCLHDQRSWRPCGARRRKLDKPRLLQGHVACRFQRQAHGHRSVHNNCWNDHVERNLGSLTGGSAAVTTTAP